MRNQRRFPFSAVSRGRKADVLLAVPIRPCLAGSGAADGPSHPALCADVLFRSKLKSKTPESGVLRHDENCSTPVLGGAILVQYNTGKRKSTAFFGGSGFGACRSTIHIGQMNKKEEG